MSLGLKVAKLLLGALYSTAETQTHGMKDKNQKKGKLTCICDM